MAAIVATVVDIFDHSKSRNEIAIIFSPPTIPAAVITTTFTYLLTNLLTY